MPKQIGKVDLTTVDPKGRLDVLAYRGAERLARWTEAKYGLQGIWDAIQPHVHELVVGNVSGINLPPEAKMLMTILQANLNQFAPQNKEGL